jgi:hypothetical protein
MCGSRLKGGQTSVVVTASTRWQLASQRSNNHLCQCHQMQRLMVLTVRWRQNSPTVPDWSCTSADVTEVGWTQQPTKT